MNTYALTMDALQEPWRLWSCHLSHPDLIHALDNGLALSIPLLLAGRNNRLRTGLWLLLLAPLLSLSLLPGLQGGEYSGLSGLACAAWVLVGLQLAVQPESAGLGSLMLGLLALKFGVEAMTGMGLLGHGGRWQGLSPSHLHGALLGLLAGVLDESASAWARRFQNSLRRSVTFPR